MAGALCTGEAGFSHVCGVWSEYRCDDVLGLSRVSSLFVHLRENKEKPTYVHWQSCSFGTCSLQGLEYQSSRVLRRGGAANVK